MNRPDDDIPFFGDEDPAPRAPAASASGGGIAARAMAARNAARPAPNYLAGLNPEQADAVESIEGPVLVLAGAGTGKTRVLTTRIAHILNLGLAYPSQILSVTFTNKAAREMKERIGVLVGGAVEGMPWLGTFHSIGVKLLRRHAELANLRSDFTILDTDDVIRLCKQLIQAEGIDDKRWPARQFANLIDGWKNKGYGPADIPEGDSRGFANGKGRALYQAYQERLQTLNAVDFGDLLCLPIRMFRANPDVLKEYQQKFRFILVDEYQDTNTAQYMWLRLLAQRPAGERPNICCVGDDDQSIYGWRGAEVENILRFEKDFPGAKVIRLERNYRSTEHILGAAGHLIAHNEGRLGKTLFTEQSDPEHERVHGACRLGFGRRGPRHRRGDRAGADQGPGIQQHGHPGPRLVPDARVRGTLRHAGAELPRHRRPALYERQEIRDAMAFFRVVSQPADDLAFERIVNVPKRGLGEAAVRQVHDVARARGIPMLEAARELVLTDEMKPKPRKSLTDVVEMFTRWQGMMETTPGHELAETILEESGYTEMWQNDRSADAPTRLENLKELVETISGFRIHARLPRARGAGYGHRQQPRSRRCLDHDAALGQGAGIRNRVPARLGGGPVPAPARARRGRPLRARGRAPSRLCRPHPRQAPLPHLVRLQPPHPRAVAVHTALALPR
jgi:DNA helicase-2/ATP-dependent DNA helicase PcrA